MSGVGRGGSFVVAAAAAVAWVIATWLLGGVYFLVLNPTAAFTIAMSPDFGGVWGLGEAATIQFVAWAVALLGWVTLGSLIVGRLFPSAHARAVIAVLGGLGLLVLDPKTWPYFVMLNIVSAVLWIWLVAVMPNKRIEQNARR